VSTISATAAHIFTNNRNYPNIQWYAINDTGAVCFLINRFNTTMLRPSQTQVFGVRSSQDFAGFWEGTGKSTLTSEMFFVQQ
jgi:hypothetical protein